MMNKLIELKNLTKNFDDQQVLRGINLDIYEKEFLTLLGPSGCGKTTTDRKSTRLNSSHIEESRMPSSA